MGFECFGGDVGWKIMGFDGVNNGVDLWGILF